MFAFLDYTSRMQLTSNLTICRDVKDSNPVTRVILSQLHCAFCVADDSNKILIICLYVFNLSCAAE